MSQVMLLLVLLYNLFRTSTWRLWRRRRCSSSASWIRILPLYTCYSEWWYSLVLQSGNTHIQGDGTDTRIPRQTEMWGRMLFWLITHREQIHMSKLSGNTEAPSSPPPRSPEQWWSPACALPPLMLLQLHMHNHFLCMHHIGGIIIRKGGSDFEPKSIIAIDYTCFEFQAVRGRIP